MTPCITVQMVSIHMITIFIIFLFTVYFRGRGILLVIECRFNLFTCPGTPLLLLTSCHFISWAIVQSRKIEKKICNFWYQEYYNNTLLNESQINHKYTCSMQIHINKQTQDKCSTSTKCVFHTSGMLEIKRFIFQNYKTFENVNTKQLPNRTEKSMQSRVNFTREGWNCCFGSIN